MKTWLKKHRITTTEAAELLGMKGPQQVRNKLAGADAITEKDVLLMHLWDFIIPQCQATADRFAAGKNEIAFDGDPDDLSGGIDAIDIAREIARGAPDTYTALERAAARS